MHLNDRVETCRKKLLNHTLYYQLNSLQDVRTFMEYHVFAVWDFMTLLKELQRRFTCVATPWVPKGDPKIRRMVNEIVLGEESDDACDALSHFEWYLKAMEETGANLKPINMFVQAIKEGTPIQELLSHPLIPKQAAEFVGFTLDVARNGKDHEIAAAFTVGRENLIPDMFTKFLKELHQEDTPEIATLLAYMERHVVVDGGDHGPLSEKMIKLLCGNDLNKWQECWSTSLESLEKRYVLWNGALFSIKERNFALETSSI